MLVLKGQRDGFNYKHLPTLAVNPATACGERSPTPGAAACWHHAEPGQPKGAQGLSFPVGHGVWGDAEGCISLGPQPKGRC